MEEKDFLELIISERMGMHHDAFKKEYTLTKEQAAEAEKADQAHELLFQQLSAEQRKMMELCEDVTNSEATRENEYYYRAGFRDGVSLDRLIKQIREDNKSINADKHKTMASRRRRFSNACFSERRVVLMGLFSGLFRARDAPQNRTSGSAYSFFMGGSTSGKRVNERSSMQMTAVYSCVRILSEAVAGLPLHMYRYTDNGGKEKAAEHPLYFLLHDEPNPEMTSFVFRETLMTHLLLWGNAYAQIIRNGKGEVIGLYPLMPDRMGVERDSKGQLYYEYTVSMDDAPTVKGSTVILPPSEVLHIPGLGFDGLVGYSPIAMAKNAIGMAIACEEYGAKFFANGAQPSGVLEHPGTLKDPSRVRESWQSTFGGSHNANKVAVLEEGMKYTPISISPEQAQFLETRKFQINEIARIFRVPPHMVGDLEKSSFSNIEQQSLEFVKYTLGPWVSRWEQSMARSLLTPEEKKQYFVKFNVDGLLRGDYQSRMNGYAVGRQNGWMSANDIRELENLDRIPEELGGDLYLINGNMTKLSDAGLFGRKDGEEESNENEEVLEVEEPGGGGDGSGGEDSVSERHHRRGKLV